MILLNTIVCYRNADEVIRYAEAMLQAEGKDLRISISVNDGSAEDRDALNRLQAAHGAEKIRIYYPQKNLGYLNGMMFAYNEYMKEQNPAPDYIIMSNTDIEIPDGEFFSKFMGRDYGPETGCIGPSVYTKHRKTYDNPVCLERRSKAEVEKVIRVLSIPVIRSIYVMLSDIKGRITNRKKSESSFVYEVHGCYFILSRPFLEKIAGKEYKALMYSEEAYISESIVRYGFRSYYDAELEVVHLEHSVTSGLRAGRIAKHIADSMTVIRDEFYTGDGKDRDTGK